jgi:hypothetical protein
VSVLSSTLFGWQSPATAANYGGFGSSYSEVIDPKTAVLNDETKHSEDVKAGIVGLEALIQSVQSIKSDLVLALVFSSSSH